MRQGADEPAPFAIRDGFENIGHPPLLPFNPDEVEGHVSTSPVPERYDAARAPEGVEMFRILKIRPPNGWHAVGWELAIVTLGVIIALAAQQWAEGRAWKAKAAEATAALKDEVSDHYAWSVEWRVVEPCIVAQIDRLQQRLLASDKRLAPAPVYSEPTKISYVVRLPSKEYHSVAWQAAIGDGVSSHLDPSLRKELSGHYAQVQSLVDLTEQNNVDQNRLLTLSKPLPLDPAVRFSLLQTLDELRGRTEFMGLLSGQLIDHIQREGMVPPATAARRDVVRFGTYRFCKDHGLPLRSFGEAITAIPN